MISRFVSRLVQAHISSKHPELDPNQLDEFKFTKDEPTPEPVDAVQLESVVNISQENLDLVGESVEPMEKSEFKVVDENPQILEVRKGQGQYTKYACLIEGCPVYKSKVRFGLSGFTVCLVLIQKHMAMNHAEIDLEQAIRDWVVVKTAVKGVTEPNGCIAKKSASKSPEKEGTEMVENKTTSKTLQKELLSLATWDRYARDYVEIPRNSRRSLTSLDLGVQAPKLNARSKSMSRVGEKENLKRSRGDVEQVGRKRNK